ncbi:hypothetical protein SDC9_127680 [bioreactor metagenome]|uniref:Uncharacterized protein n=1 Tax=bioreactor metagenome TaxID=1076179 RepID=A0A645CU36_9ZZZZ
MRFGDSARRNPEGILLLPDQFAFRRINAESQLAVRIPQQGIADPEIKLDLRVRSMGKASVLAPDINLLARIGDIRQISQIVDANASAGGFGNAKQQMAHGDRERYLIKIRHGRTVKRKPVIAPAVFMVKRDLFCDESLAGFVLKLKRERGVMFPRIGGEGDCRGNRPRLVNSIFGESRDSVLLLKGKPDFAAISVIAFRCGNRTEAEIDRPGRRRLVSPARASQPAGDVGEIVEHKPSLPGGIDRIMVVPAQKRGVQFIPILFHIRRTQLFCGFPFAGVKSGQIPIAGIPGLP